jgi:PhnB protein
MNTINPYLNFSGDAEEAFKFYRSVFGGEFRLLQRFQDTPEAPKIPMEEKGKIMHVSLPVGNGNTLMATDALESMGQKLTFGNNISLLVEAESKEEAGRLFAGLSPGGKVRMPLADTFWGAYFGMLTDQFGIQWMISYTQNQQRG